MKEGELKKQLLKEGFKDVYSWEDKPHEFYSRHNHPYDTKLIILEGSIKLTLENKVLELKSGDNIYIKANEINEAKVGKKGCKYLVEEVK